MKLGDTLAREAFTVLEQKDQRLIENASFGIQDLSKRSFPGRR